MHVPRGSALTNDAPDPADGALGSRPVRPPGGLESAALAALHLLAQALVVVEPSGQVLFANRPARKLAQAGEVGRPAAVRLTRDGRIEAALRADDRALQAMLLASERIGGVVLRHPAAGSVVVLAAAIPVGGRAAASSPEPAAIVVLLLPVETLPIPSAERLRGLFGLSPAEAAVALAAAGGASAQAIAAERGVAEATVRAQLRRVLEKTGAGGLRQLARLFGSLADGLS